MSGFIAGLVWKSDDGIISVISKWVEKDMRAKQACGVTSLLDGNAHGSKCCRYRRVVWPTVGEIKQGRQEYLWRNGV